MIVVCAISYNLLAPFVARTVGLEEGYESFKHRVWAGGVDVFFDREEELKTFLERYGEYTYSTRMEELEEVVGKLLKERGIKLCTAESCTARFAFRKDSECGRLVPILCGWVCGLL